MVSIQDLENQVSGKQPAVSTAKQAGKFSIVGVFNTLFDFGMVNLFTRVFQLALIPANTISTGIAMIVSFFLNKNLVFESRGERGTVKQIIIFFVVTAFGLWVLQNGVVYLLERSLAFKNFAIFARKILFGIFDDKFFIENGAKAIGTAFSLVWNFVLYKKVVFKK